LFLPLIFFVGLLVLIQLYLVLEKTFSGSNFVLHDDAFNFHTFVDPLTSIDVLGQSLYNYYLVCFLIAGLILLVAMIGAIVLTLNFSSQRKNELVSRQLSRSDNFLAFFK